MRKYCRCCAQFVGVVSMNLASGIHRHVLTAACAWHQMCFDFSSSAG
jgi:hypothetical protein